MPPVDYTTSHPETVPASSRHNSSSSSSPRSHSPESTGLGSPFAVIGTPRGQTRAQITTPSEPSSGTLSSEEISPIDVESKHKLGSEITLKPNTTKMAPVNVLMVGTGEYTTGFVGTGASTSDKKVGVVGLTMFDLRRRGKVGELSMVGVNGKKYPAIREHLDKNISQVYNGLDVSFKSFPADDAVDADSYKAAIDQLSPGDAITIFTPDTTHYPIALYAIQRKIHVLLTKPATKTIEEHQHLIRESRKYGVFVFVEHHKRFDPAYSDARAKAQKLGDFNYFYSYMSQPKSQLETFKAWAGKDSDISYYLNSHHVDINESMVPGWKPYKVTASGSRGCATDLGCVPGTEDTITLLVDWVKKDDPTKVATGVYTSSWTAPQKAGVHSNQYFHYLGSKGEIRINQAKRGYDVADDETTGLMWYNPFYMRYAPDEEGNFGGQSGYGYVSFEKFIDACNKLNAGEITLEELDKRGLPTLANTAATGAILHAGRVSLDEKRTVYLEENEGVWRLGCASGSSCIVHAPPTAASLNGTTVREEPEIKSVTTTEPTATEAAAPSTPTSTGQPTKATTDSKVVERKASNSSLPSLVKRQKSVINWWKKRKNRKSAIPIVETRA
ncbi:hypothetical protein H072_8973 [Dactylellina haptotyla CBS 200.50]|uniref:Gfo/Idh/MocA-like oxidoreductase N-terminal domain-containing protein n=1 Tax=Dactylellina haptotyla (strain CBS 200.50) TaxID=1284197 RepID=S8BQ76_DACHA|nr:hypothetical protein H072_8973 [Dactylellina haptotyla CBS 200.50]